MAQGVELHEHRKPCPPRAADSRTLEKTKHPGIYRRHANGCQGNGRCRCPYVVRWKRGGTSHKQMFPTFELAREFKGKLDGGKSTRRPLSSQTVADYYNTWIKRYRGRTARGLEPSSRREYEISFRLHILPLIGRMRMRDVAAPDVRDWLQALEREGATQPTIRKAKAALQVMFPRRCRTASSARTRQSASATCPRHRPLLAPERAPSPKTPGGGPGRSKRMTFSGRRRLRFQVASTHPKSPCFRSISDALLPRSLRFHHQLTAPAPLTRPGARPQTQEV
jgi:Phage integrase, N-terminal SAM-like domain